MTEAELTQLRRVAYEAACLAESAWEDELARTYPNDNNHGRYERRKNRATPMLKALDDVRAAFTEAWLTLGKIARNEI
jgi:hypothetical protein